MEGYKRDIKLSKYQDEILSLAVLNNGIIIPEEDLYILHTGNSEKRVNKRTVNVLLDSDIIREKEDGTFIFNEKVYNFYMNQQIYSVIKPFYYEGVLIEPIDMSVKKYAESSEVFPFIDWNYCTFLDETSLNGCSLYTIFKINNNYYKPSAKGCFKVLEI